MSYYCPLIYKYEYLLYLNNYKGILRQNMIVTASVPNRLVLKKMLSLSLSVAVWFYSERQKNIPIRVKNY